MTDFMCVMPSIEARRETRLITLRQLGSVGLDPLVVEQHPTVPYGSDGSTLTAKEALRQGAMLGDGGVLFVEDDVDVDPLLENVLDQIVCCEVPVSLWHRPQFVPREHRDLDEGFEIVNAVSVRNWFGTLAVWFPPTFLNLFLNTPHNGHGTDIHMRNLCVEHDIPLHITLPSLVEHREGRRYASRNGNRVTSDDYRGPLSGQ